MLSQKQESRFQLKYHQDLCSVKQLSITMKGWFPWTGESLQFNFHRKLEVIKIISDHSKILILFNINDFININDWLISRIFCCWCACRFDCWLWAIIAITRTTMWAVLLKFNVFEFISSSQNLFFKGQNIIPHKGSFDDSLRNLEHIPFCNPLNHIPKCS